MMPKNKPDEQRYFLDGIPVPGVTDIIKDCGLTGDFYTEWGADKGTAVHLACQYHDETTLDESTLDEYLIPYLNAWKQFKKDSGFVPIMEFTEREFVSPSLKFGGRIDRYGTWNAGGFFVLDIKSGSKQKWWSLQTAAYEYLLTHSGIPQIPHSLKRICLELKDNGKYKCHEFSDPNDIKVFKSCLEIYNWKRRV